MLTEKVFMNVNQGVLNWFSTSGLNPAEAWFLLIYLAFVSVKLSRTMPCWDSTTS